MDPMERWVAADKDAPKSISVAGVEVAKGSRVRVWPLARRDIFDLALQGRIAVVDGIEQDVDDEIHLAVTLVDDPGRELGEARQPGHRFFFSPDEVEPLGASESGDPQGRRILVAGIGNVFLGDDGFGVEVATRLAERALPEGVTVVDFGIRGLDLAYALQDPYDVVIFVDAAPRGGAPGTVYVIDAEVEEDGDAVVDTHGMDPVKVLAMARGLGRLPPRAFVVGCEPQNVLRGEGYDDMLLELSPPVRAAVDVAVNEVRALVDDLLTQDPTSQKEV